MINYLFHSYFIWIIYFSSNVIHILGHHDLHHHSSGRHDLHHHHNSGHYDLKACINNNSLFIQLLNIISCSFILMILGISILTLVNYNQIQNIRSFIGFKKRNLLNQDTKIRKKKIYKEIIDLPNFIPLTSHRFFHIDPKISPATLDELNIAATQTKRFTMVPHGTITSRNKSIEIEFVQEPESIIVLIKISHNYSPVLLTKINRLSSTIFNTCNIIQTWGDISHYLFNYKDYGFLFYDDFDNVILLDIQENFKTWYNRTFDHNETCAQLLDYNTFDGPFCSCSHRPYKQADDNWSLPMAVAYTFHEKLHNENENINRCLAVTKLSHVIKEKWSRPQIQDYIKQHHVDELVA